MFYYRSFSFGQRIVNHIKTIKRCYSSNPKSNFTIKNKSFVVSYDGQLKQPKWVLEILTHKSLRIHVTRKFQSFKNDFRVPSVVQSSTNDFKSSGFDRGHMAPASNHRTSLSSMKETYYLSNCSPQNPFFNQKQWLKLEKYIRGLVAQHKEISVVTGPLFVPVKKGDKKFICYEVIGKNNVAVPNSFFKVIQARDFEESYIVPNRVLSKVKSIKEFFTTKEKVEKLSGVIIPEFRNLNRVRGNLKLQDERDRD